MKNITFGLTGGIACGKSNITRTFINHNIPMVDADIVSRQVVAPGTIGLERIISHFGVEYLADNGELNRSKLGFHIFNDPAERKALDKIMKPLIEEESANQIAELHKTNPIVGYDGPLIIEMGNADKYNPLIVAFCPRWMQVERLMKRNSFTLDEANQRIDSQMPSEEKLKYADWVVDTSFTKENSIKQTEIILEKLKEMLNEEN